MQSSVNVEERLMDGISCQDRVLCYMVRTPWRWVFNEAVELRFRDYLLKELRVSEIKQLSTSRKFQSNSFVSSHGPSTLRAEILRLDDSSFCLKDEKDLQVEKSTVEKIVLGTSTALDGLSDKDQFVDVMERCGAGFAIPPSILINWDATYEEIKEIEFPTCEDCKICDSTSQDSDIIFSVLKTPLGSRGEGVFFVSTHDEIWEKVHSNYLRALSEGNGKFIEEMQLTKGRIPSWVLSSEIKSLQILSRKCHFRTYAIIIEESNDERVGEEWEGFIYNSHEVRIAEKEMIEAIGEKKRDRAAHITNGASEGKTGRFIIDEIEELPSDFGKSLEKFVAEVFDCLVNEISIRISKDKDVCKITKMAWAGIDIMSDSSGRLYVLEVNVNPAAPPKQYLSERFQLHLASLARDTLDLIFQDMHGGRREAVGGWIPMRAKLE